MSDTNKKTDQEKGDEVLRRMLKTPPKPKEKGGGRNPHPNASEKDIENGSDTNQA
jgi:hypothetical protein